MTVTFREARIKDEKLFQELISQFTIDPSLNSLVNSFSSSICSGEAISITILLIKIIKINKMCYYYLFSDILKFSCILLNNKIVDLSRHNLEMVSNFCYQGLWWFFDCVTIRSIFVILLRKGALPFIFGGSMYDKP